VNAIPARLSGPMTRMENAMDQLLERRNISDGAALR
jgi:hypothetical protein